jgi:hypothetical protein
LPDKLLVRGLFEPEEREVPPIKYIKLKGNAGLRKNTRAIIVIRK